MPSVALSPTRPEQEAGPRVEPAPSVASDSGPMPAATAATAPPLDPPGVSAGFHGLPVTPNSGFAVYPSLANSGTLVLPRISAPASRARAAASSSCAGR